jgi:hypothetical protein
MMIYLIYKRGVGTPPIGWVPTLEVATRLVTAGFPTMDWVGVAELEPPSTTPTPTPFPSLRWAPSAGGERVLQQYRGEAIGWCDVPCEVNPAPNLARVEEELTPEMIKAGARVIARDSGADWAEDLAAKVYSAMNEARYAGRCFYPPTDRERNLSGVPRIGFEDIASFAIQVGYRERYTAAGWGKAVDLNVARSLGG